MATKTVSYSEIDTYRQCRFKHQLAYLERWQTDDVAPALSRGSLFHAVMEKHYLTQGAAIEVGEAPTAEDLFLAVAPLLYEEDTANQTEEQELVEWIYRGYVECYKLDPMWEVIAVEQRIEDWLPTARGTRSTFKMAGTADLIVRDWSMGGGLWIVDHKTCRDLPKDKDLDMEDQTAIYAFLLLRAGLDIRGAIYNHCRTYKLKTREMDMDERFKRTPTVRTPTEIETCALEALDLMREAYRRRGDAPRSPNMDTCRWKCNFTEACLAGRKAGTAQRTREFLGDIGFEQKEYKPGPTFAPKKD